jgi:ATP-dependent helicase HrpB
MRQAKRVVARRERRFRDLVLEARSKQRGRPARRGGGLACAARCWPGGITIDAWDEAVEQWIIRVNRIWRMVSGIRGQPLTDRRTG